MNILLLSSSYIRYRLDKGIYNVFDEIGCHVTKYYAMTHHVACDDEMITYLTLAHPGLIMSVFTLDEYKKYIKDEPTMGQSPLIQWLDAL